MDKSRRIGRKKPCTERSRQPLATPEAKLRAIRKALEYSFPTADIQQMLAEIERDRRR